MNGWIDSDWFCCLWSSGCHPSQDCQVSTIPLLWLSQSKGGLFYCLFRFLRFFPKWFFQLSLSQWLTIIWLYPYPCSHPMTITCWDANNLGWRQIRRIWIRQEESRPLSLPWITRSRRIPSCVSVGRQIPLCHGPRRSRRTTPWMLAIAWNPRMEVVFRNPKTSNFAFLYPQSWTIYFLCNIIIAIKQWL